VNKPSFGALGFAGWHHTLAYQGDWSISSNMVRWGGLAGVVAHCCAPLSVSMHTLLAPPVTAMSWRHNAVS
jgi:hypothetical protein